MDFYDLDLNDDVLDALDDMRFTECTPIQEHAIPAILDGHDLIGVAQTGTGKTAAYLLPVLSLLSDGGYPTDSINCIIMSPTRELAQQIDQAMQGFSYYMPGVSSVAVYGGNDGNRYDQEKRGLQMGADVIIATPGRLISHISLGNVDLSRVSFFILDEADRMLDMGFSEDIMQIERQLTNPQRQTIMFSATMPQKIVDLAKTILHDPVEIKLAVSKPADGIHQSAYVCYDPQKLGIIKSLFSQKAPHRVIIFVGSKIKVKDIAIAIKRAGYNAEAMHSDLDQAQRDDVMYRFKTQQVDVLVATDIVARGIDIDDIQLVINYDVPRDVEDYVHRIGRTARAGAEGKAITFVNEADQHYFMQIERFLGYEVQKNDMPKELGEGPKYTGERVREERGGRGGKGRGRGKGGNRRKQQQGGNGRSKHKDSARQPKQQSQANPAQQPGQQAQPAAQTNNAAKKSKRRKKVKKESSEK